MKDYEIAKICLNGHIDTSKSNSVDITEKFCPECGESIISACPECSTAIKGGERYNSVIDNGYRYYNILYEHPAYCYNCGRAFPWTQRSLDAANELIDLADELNEAEKNELKISISGLLVQTPKTAVSELKFMKYAKKGGSEIMKGLKDILIDVVSESVKKTIWG